MSKIDSAAVQADPGRAAAELGADPGCGPFLRDFEPRFTAEFARACRAATGRELREAGIVLDPRGLYRALFLPADAANATGNVRAYLKELAGSTDEAEPMLKRTWMIMASRFVDYGVSNGLDSRDVDALQELIESYSSLLDGVRLEMSQSPSLELPWLELASDDYLNTIDGFRRYLVEDLSDDQRRQLRVFTCFRGIPVDSPAVVVSVGEDEVTFQVSPTQISILSKMGLALVESPVHDVAFRAYSRSVDKRSHQVTFSHFVRHDQPLERREHQRVRPIIPIRACIRRGSKQYTGWLFDASAVAAAILLRDPEAGALAQGDVVELECEWPEVDGKRKFDLCGRVILIHHHQEEDQDASRVIVRLPGGSKLLERIRGRERGGNDKPVA